MIISVIIPTLDEACLVTGAVQAAWLAGADEVLVSDGGSADATAKLARDAGAQVVTTGKGRGQQQRAAAELARGEILSFLHVDTWLEPGGLDQIRDRLEETQVIWGGFAQRVESEKRIYRLLERGNRWRVKHRHLVYGDQGIFVRRRALQRVGGYPELPLMEDVELSRRLGKLAQPVLLPGPLHVNDRHWRLRGPIRQTLHNWRVFTLYRFGVPPERLLRSYSPAHAHRESS